VDARLASGTPGQREVWAWVKNPRDARVCAWQGGFGAGKSVGAFVALLKMAQSRGLVRGRFLLGGVSTESVLSVVLPIAQSLAGQFGVSFALRHTPRPRLLFGGHTFLIFGGSKANSAASIQGLSVHAAWLDETTQLHQSFYDMALTRCREGTAPVLIATFNPDRTNHWMRTDVIQRALDGDPRIKYVSSHTDENQHLHTRQKEVGRMVSLSHKRGQLVDNEWTDAAGRVFSAPGLAATPTGGARPWHERPVWLGVDYGTSGVTAVVALVKDGLGWVIADEYIWDNQTQGYRPDVQHVQAITEKWPPARTVDIRIDHNAANLASLLRKAGYQVYNAYKRREKGISLTEGMLSEGRLKVAAGAAPYLLGEMAGYVWNPDTGDTDNKCRDDACDALRYTAVGRYNAI